MYYFLVTQLYKVGNFLIYDKLVTLAKKYLIAVTCELRNSGKDQDLLVCAILSHGTENDIFSVKYPKSTKINFKSTSELNETRGVLNLNKVKSHLKSIQVQGKLATIAAEEFRASLFELDYFVHYFSMQPYLKGKPKIIIKLVSLFIILGIYFRFLYGKILRFLVK